MQQSNIRNLWKRAFQDSEKYMDYYFSHKMPVSDVYTDEESGELVSMAFFTPYDICLKGKNCRSFYIVGVATEEKYRHCHRMTALMKNALEQCRAETPLVFLCPENPAVYQSLGFAPVYWRTTAYVSLDGNFFQTGETCRILTWQELDARKKENVCSFANEMLEKEKFDLYMKRDERYYNEISRELMALDGCLLTVWNVLGEMEAVVNVIYEEDRYQITECIVKPSCAQKIVSSLFLYLDTGFMQFDDSYFLYELTEKNGDAGNCSAQRNAEAGGISVCYEKQERPYIMCKILSGDAASLPKRCYINDIT
jgi:predicted acetyltransferase